MPTNDNFSWETLHDYIDIDAHIDFASSLINKYRWPEEVGKKLRAQLKQIKDKQQDTMLNLSVVGEFSTGKSSFINALLGHELLTSSAIQGTTVVNTLIEYCDYYKITTVYNDGHTDILGYQGTQNMAKDLSAITTDSTKARDIYMVRVGLPSALLSDGIRIIDTPGTNSLESWHEDVTREALRELSDLSIILNDSLHPAPQTLLDFVSDNLSDIYEQCSFVCTYFDAIRKKERASQLEYIKKKLTSELGISEPMVVPFIAPAVISKNRGEELTDKEEEYCAISEQSAKQLMVYMAERRKIAQIKKVMALTTKIFTLLENSINKKKDEAERRLRLLQKSKTADLSSFVQKEKQESNNTFGIQAAQVGCKLRTKLKKRQETSLTNLTNSITNANTTSVDDLKNFMENTFPGKCETEAKKVAALSSIFSIELVDHMKDVIKAFQGRFENQFEKLGILKVDFSMKLAGKASTSVDRGNMNTSIDYLNGVVGQENWAYGGGIVTGVAIGTAILPGIGTAIGFFVGLFGGALFAPSVDTTKKKLIEKVRPKLVDYLDRVGTDTIAAFDKNVIKFEDAISNEIDRYLQIYKATVDESIAEHNKRMKSLRSEIDRVTTDLTLIKQHKETLMQIRSSIHHGH